MSTYINIHRIKDLVHDGECNIPFGTPFEVDSDGFLYTLDDEGKPFRVCWETSERAYRDFAYNADGCGEERKDVINDCIDTMSHINKDEHFGSLLYDPVCMRYKKNQNDSSEWSWDRLKVHKAPIADLKYMQTVFKSMPKMLGGVPDNRPIIDLRFVRFKAI